MNLLFNKIQLLQLLYDDVDKAIDHDKDPVNTTILNNIIHHLTNQQLIWLSFYNPPFGIGVDRSIRLTKIMACIYSIFQYRQDIQKYKSMVGLHLMYIQYSTHVIIKRNVIRLWFEKIRNPIRLRTLREITLHPMHNWYNFPLHLFPTIYQFL